MDRTNEEYERLKKLVGNQEFREMARRVAEIEAEIDCEAQDRIAGS
jgi:hypothetical protein